MRASVGVPTILEAALDRPTIHVYEHAATAYAARRPPRWVDRATALDGARLPGLPVVDVGCGPGGYLGALGPPVIALDAARAMLDLAGAAAPAALRLQADLEALPFRDRSLGGAWARNSYLHVARVDLPLALARLQWALAVGAPLHLSVTTGDGEGSWPDDDLPGRFFARWRPDRISDVVTGAGFDVAVVDAPADDTWVLARRARTLPDTVGAGMSVLVCGLNPSLVAADAGVGYAGPTNRFWPAAVAAGLVSRERDPLHALTAHGVGMTDLVKRATPRADGVTPDEYRAGAARVHRLVTWLRPRAVVFVGLGGWRVAVDRRAGPGPQPDGFAGVPAYVLPSTSGLNARTTRAELVEHLRRAAALAQE